MTPRRRFVPSEITRLEDRVVLSRVGAMAEVAAAAQPQNLQATFRGRYLTTAAPGLGGGETASLAGSTTLRQLGRIGLSGSLSSNPTVSPQSALTQGFLVVRGSRQFPGSATLVVTGPATDLSPAARTTTRLAFTVANTSGRFSVLAHATGVIDLTLQKARLFRNGGAARGQFTMVVSQR